MPEIETQGFETLFEAIIDYMHREGWREFTAKSRDFEQSLFDHCLLEVDAFFQLVPILAQPKHWGLTTDEITLVAVTLMAHDVGKRLPEWQDYVSGRRSALSDVNRALTARIVPELYPSLGLGETPSGLQAVLENCINLHMRHERKAGNLVQAILNPGSGTTRWFGLAEIVYHIDNLCSIGNPLGAVDYLRRSSTPFARHLDSDYHLLALRGVSSVLLHRAAEDAYRNSGWKPLLFYPEATVYVRSAGDERITPSRMEVETRLARALESCLGSDVAQLVVGRPTASMLPKPELFDPSEMRRYLQVAASRINRGSFRKKKADKRRKPVADYLGVAASELEDSILERESERMSDAQPDMVVFKFFKAALEQIDRTVPVATTLYEDLMGSDAWQELSRMSTLMPAKDMPHVDRFWRLAGQRLGQTVETLEELPPDARTAILIDELTRIADIVFSQSTPPSRSGLMKEMAKSFLRDLVVPAEDDGDLKRICDQQLHDYERSKPFAGRVVRRGPKHYFCPVCNAPFENGTEAKADFLDKPESHTNRALAHGSFTRLVICRACRFERTLRQLLMNARPAEIVLLFPRSHLGPGAGARLVSKVRELYSRWCDFDDPDRMVSLGLTWNTAQHQLGRPAFGLSAAEAAELFSFRLSEENRKKRRRELEKALKEGFDDVDAANVEWGTEFTSWSEAVEAVAANRVEDARELRRDVLGLEPRMALVCETPNVLMIPILYPVGQKSDSDTNAALKKLFVSLILGLSLDCAAAIVPDSQPLLVAPRGVAWIPPVGPARRLVVNLLQRLERARMQGGHANLSRLQDMQWVPLEHAPRMLEVLGAASLVAGWTAFSEANNLFAVLSAPTVGHVLRRIEQKSETGTASPDNIRALRYLEEVLL